MPIKKTHRVENSFKGLRVIRHFLSYVWASFIPMTNLVDNSILEGGWAIEVFGKRSYMLRISFSQFNFQEINCLLQLEDNPVKRHFGGQQAVEFLSPTHDYSSKSLLWSKFCEETSCAMSAFWKPYSLEEKQVNGSFWGKRRSIVTAIKYEQSLTQISWRKLFSTRVWQYPLKRM